MSFTVGSSELSFEAALNVLSFSGAILLLLCTYKAFKCKDANRKINETLYAPLNEVDPISNVTPFSKAGFFSKISFWWLNPLMKSGRDKTLLDEDIPKLREFDRAKSCYILFVEQLNKQKQHESSSYSSVFWTIILCHRREILITGLFALLKVLTLSCAPLLLNEFILVAEGKISFKYQGYVLAVSLLFIKIIGSVSQRQWCFRSKLVGMKVRSLLTAAIYKKMLRLTNSARLIHSSDNLRNVELKLLSAVQVRKAYIVFLFWISPVLVSAASFLACYFLKVPLHASNVFTFLATLRLVQEPISSIPDVISAIIEAKVAFARIANFLDAPELQRENIRKKCFNHNHKDSISIKCADFSWEGNASKPTLRNINMDVRHGQKVAICGEVGSGKSTLIATILGEVSKTNGTIDVHGKFAYVAQTAWIQTVTIHDPFSSVDAHTAKKLFNEYLMEGLKEKTVIVVTHQVEFLPSFDSILLMSNGEILQAGPYHQLLTSSQEFNDLVNTHKETAGSDQLSSATFSQRHSTSRKSTQASLSNKYKAQNGNQLIQKEEREKGDTGLKPYLQYMNQMKGYILFSTAFLSHLIFVVCQILQNSWMASNVDNPLVSTLKLILVYFFIGGLSTIFLLSRCLLVVTLGLQSSKHLFSQLMNSLFCAPMSFYDSTPLGRVLSRVSSDLSTMDLDLPFSLSYSVGATINLYSTLADLAVFTWQVLIVAIPMVYVATRIQRYYFASAKEVMRMNGTTKSSLTNHVNETVAGAATIRAFEEEDRSFNKNLDLIDINAALCIVTFPPGTFTPGIIAMALSYGLSLNNSLIFSIKNQCTLANHIISVERLNQYMHIESEAEEIVEGNRAPLNWPVAGKVEINDLKIRYRPDGPLDPTLFNGTVKYNLDPLYQHTDLEILEVLVKCQLREVVQQKEKGLNSSVCEDGSNWSMGQRQLFCLARALLRKSRILVLDEATASIDNSTDLIMQKTIRTEFADCTVITVAHRIPTVMDCSMVLAISDGKLAEYDEPMNLMKREESLFGKLVKEYWSHFQSAESH
ncbi:ABC transporter C family member [Trifolium repens]|nr:ABC transporter C family member [Trifolium repens]